jgi:hypothetical protein
VNPVALPYSSAEISIFITQILNIERIISDEFYGKSETHRRI